MADICASYLESLQFEALLGGQKFWLQFCEFTNFLSKNYHNNWQKGRYKKKQYEA
jgi:hypothetical protein